VYFVEVVLAALQQATIQLAAHKVQVLMTVCCMERQESLVVYSSWIVVGRWQHSCIQI
jgi:hypothetical protein